MQESEQPVLGRRDPALSGARPDLTADELWQLTLFKWRYSLEASGFSAAEVRQLMFHKWRVYRLKLQS